MSTLTDLQEAEAKVKAGLEELRTAAMNAGAEQAQRRLFTAHEVMALLESQRQLCAVHAHRDRESVLRTPLIHIPTKPTP